MIANIIGLGNCGCAIASKFEELDNYDVYKINTENLDETNPKHFLMKKQKSPEDYENQPLKLKKFFQSIHEPVLFIIGGSGMISSASLLILEQLKGKAPVSFLYVVPDRDFLTKTDAMLDRMVYGVLQEKVRSGIFERFWIVSNNQIEKLAEGIPIGKFYDVLNETIASTFHALNIYSNEKPLAGELQGIPVGARISTFGFVNEEKNEDCLYFPLDFVSDRQYIYARSEETLNNDRSLLKQIKEQTIERTQTDEKGVKPRASFIVLESETDFTYVMAHTSLIQEF